MSGYRVILARLLKEQVGSHAKIAKAMGWGSPSTAGNKLRGERGWDEGELERMCELAGTTIVALGAMASDLKVTKHPESVEAASITDDLNASDRKIAVEYLRSFKAIRSDR